VFKILFRNSSRWIEACQFRGHPLHFKDCIGERKYGLGHLLLVNCCYEDCKLVNEIATGRRHKAIADGVAWDVNTKLAAGKLYTITYYQII
jgi:hypothetical protein